MLEHATAQASLVRSEVRSAQFLGTGPKCNQETNLADSSWGHFGIALAQNANLAGPNNCLMCQMQSKPRALALAESSAGTGSSFHAQGSRHVGMVRFGRRRKVTLSTPGLIDVDHWKPTRCWTFREKDCGHDDADCIRLLGRYLRLRQPNQTFMLTLTCCTSFGQAIASASFSLGTTVGLGGPACLSPPLAHIPVFFLLQVSVIADCGLSRRFDGHV